MPRCRRRAASATSASWRVHPRLLASADCSALWSGLDARSPIRGCPARAASSSPSVRDAAAPSAVRSSSAQSAYGRPSLDRRRPSAGTGGTRVQRSSASAPGRTLKPSRLVRSPAPSYEPGPGGRGSGWHRRRGRRSGSPRSWRSRPAPPRAPAGASCRAAPSRCGHLVEGVPVAHAGDEREAEPLAVLRGQLGQLVVALLVQPGQPEDGLVAERVLTLLAVGDAVGARGRGRSR